MSGDPERDLRTLFHEVRDADIARAPGFARTLASRAAAPARFRTSISVITVATAVALVALMVFVSGDRTRAATVPSIAEWRPASDVLLQIARPSDFAQLQRLGTSSLNTLVPIALSKPGVRR